MKIAVVGPGAMGSLFGGLLARAGEDIWMVGRVGPKVEALQRNGLELEEGGRRETFAVKATTEVATVGATDLVLICVKGYDTAAAAQAARALLGPETLVLTLQNGLGNAETIAAAVGEERTLVGVTAHGATLLGPGRVSHRGAGDTVFGPLRGAPVSRVTEIAAVFSRAGIASRATPDPLPEVWGKLLTNAGINALTAICRLRNGDLLAHDGTRELLAAAVREGAAVAAAKGIRLPYPDPVAHTEEVARATGANYSSMLQDVLARRRTEIDTINGALAREGASVGVPTPVNATLASLVRTIEASYGEWVG